MGNENCQFPFLRLFPCLLLFEDVPLSGFGFEAGAVLLLLAEGLWAGADERAVALDLVVVLREGCFTCGAVLLSAFWPEGGAAFRLLTEGFLVSVLVRVGCFTCGAVLLSAFCLEEGDSCRLFTEGF